MCVRFIINLPREELESVERICFQVEEAQWFYEDFIRPLDPGLPSLSLKAFALRIFQHCPLMASWSKYHHMTAFSEFLAYKTRVPVRGAIMLNQEMDEVVLVKGWKKGANWSFPRGKINKDEKDLDCAIREVYEETGHDIREAGLVPGDENVKFIEITMREQHMRLYVFRGVPHDAYFEPRTRKEISKIEWWKLSDLPTLKKSKQYDQGQAAANANKFYMVAPFLHPLKKWIAQQKKLDPKTHLDAGQALNDGEFSMDEGLQATNVGHLPNKVPLEAAVPSDLPEVASSQDASAHLKRLLNINASLPAPAPVQELFNADQSSSKSHALLELLRSGSSGNPLSQPHMDRPGPHPPSGFFPGFPQQYVGPMGDVPRFPPPYRDPSQVPFSSANQHPPQIPPAFSAAPPSGILAGYPGAFDPSQRRPAPPRPPLPPGFHPTPGQGPAPAPYQRTGDPQFSHSAQPPQIHGAAIPPASNLPPPKLTSHSLALLNVFRDEKKQPPQTATANLGAQPEAPQRNARKASHHQDQLLSLLKGSPGPATSRPAELSAHPASPGRKQILQRPNAGSSTNQQATKGAWTSATVSGPLNTPQFEAIPKSSTRKKNDSRRQGSRDRQTQPLASPITILPRPQSAKREQTPSPRQMPPAQTSRPRPVKAKSPEPAKTFQPQILRRSDKAAMEEDILPIRTKDREEPQATAGLSGSPHVPISQPDTYRRPSQTPAQREALLSLFSKSAPSPKGPPAEQLNLQTSVSKHSTTPSVVSPLTPHHHLAGNGVPSDQGSSIDRVASPANKAFLLGFLEGVAKGSK